MILEAIKQFKWVDVFILILLFRVCYIAIKTGFSVEVFKLFGTVCAIYLSLHYYIVISDFLIDRLRLQVIPVEFLDFLCFAILATVGYLSFVAIRMSFFRLIKVEAVSLLNRWGGLIISIVRGVMLISLIVYALAISSITYLRNSVDNAYLGKIVLKIAPGIYSGIWNGLSSKFMPQEKFNQNVSETVEGFKK